MMNVFGVNKETLKLLGGTRVPYEIVSRKVPVRKVKGSRALPQGSRNFLFSNFIL